MCAFAETLFINFGLYQQRKQQHETPVEKQTQYDKISDCCALKMFVKTYTTHDYESTSDIRANRWSIFSLSVFVRFVYLCFGFNVLLSHCHTSHQFYFIFRKYLCNITAHTTRSTNRTGRRSKRKEFPLLQWQFGHHSQHRRECHVLSSIIS